VDSVGGIQEKGCVLGIILLSFKHVVLRSNNQILWNKRVPLKNDKRWTILKHIKSPFLLLLLLGYTSKRFL
jgi:hypothetical protein